MCSSSDTQTTSGWKYIGKRFNLIFTVYGFNMDGELLLSMANKNKPFYKKVSVIDIY